MIDGLDRTNETIAKYLPEYHQFASELPIERRIELISDLVKGMTFEEVEAKFNSVWKQMEDFIPMGSKEEVERIKRKGLSLEQESAKKQKTSEEVTEEAKSPDEVPEEKVKEMMQLVPIEEVYVEALQVKHPIIDWKRLVKETLSNRPPTSDKEMEIWVELSRLYEPDDKDQLWIHTQNLMHAPVEWKHYDSCGVHHVTAKDKEIFMQDYPLRKGLVLVMIYYKLQVENYSQMENDLILKIYKIANSPRQQGIEFPLAEEVPTASEEGSHCQKKRDVTARKIALLSKSSRNCQSKSNDSFTNPPRQWHRLEKPPLLLLWWLWGSRWWWRGVCGHGSEEAAAVGVSGVGSGVVTMELRQWRRWTLWWRRLLIRVAVHGDGGWWIG
nr:hypothetical protein [Tanacetum cinerariifolium]